METNLTPPTATNLPIHPAANLLAGRLVDIRRQGQFDAATPRFRYDGLRDDMHKLYAAPGALLVAVAVDGRPADQIALAD